MIRKFTLTLFFLLSWQVSAQNFLSDIESIKYHLSNQELQYHLKNDKPIPGVYFYSLMSGANPPIDGCPEPEIKKSGPSFNVLFILEDRPFAPNLMKMQPDDRPMVHVVMVKTEGDDQKGPPPLPAAPTGGRPVEGAIVYFKQESMDELIAYSNELVEFKYVSGMQMQDSPLFPGDPQSVPIDSTQVNWVKRANLRLHLSPMFHLRSDLQIQETLGPSDPKKADSAGQMEKMTFHTNQVNVHVGTETHVTKRVTLRAGLEYEDSPAGMSAGVLSGVDIKIPAGGQLMVFSGYKAPIDPGSSQFFLPVPGMGQGGTAGVRYQMPNGIQFKAGVNGVGSQTPAVETGVAIPLDFSPKK